GRHEDALRAANLGVARCLADEYRVDCPNVFQRRAEAYLAKGDRDAALRDIATALDRIEGARARLLPSDFFKQEFVQRREGIYSLAIDLQLQHGDREEAVETAELARSRAFIDLLASRDLAVKSPDDLTWRGAAASASPRDLRSVVTASPAREA